MKVFWVGNLESPKNVVPQVNQHVCSKTACSDVVFARYPFQIQHTRVKSPCSGVVCFKTPFQSEGICSKFLCSVVVFPKNPSQIHFGFMLSKKSKSKMILLGPRQFLMKNIMSTKKLDLKNP